MSSVDSLGSIQDNYIKYADMFESQSKDTISMETFYQLLMAEMSNQDPLEPMSNTEFISQMASFTSLKAQQDALYYNNANYAQSLVGKTVTVATTNGNDVKSISGIVTSMSLQNSEFNIKVNGEYYPLANIMEVLPSNNPYTVSGEDAAYGASLIGKQVTVEGKNEDGEVIYQTGVVSHIEIKDTSVSVVIDDLAYPISGVLKVENKAAENTGNSNNSDDTDKTVNPADVSYASTLIGKLASFTLEDEEGIYDESGIIERIAVNDGKVFLVANDKEYSLNSLTGIENPPITETESSNENQTAENQENSETQAEAYSESGEAVAAQTETTAAAQVNSTAPVTATAATTENNTVEATAVSSANQTDTASDAVNQSIDGESQVASTESSETDDTEELRALFG